MPFQPGERVRVEGIRGPNMVIMNTVLQDGVPVHRCMWFTHDAKPQHYEFPDSILIPSPAPQAPADRQKSGLRLVVDNIEPNNPDIVAISDGLIFYDNGDIAF